MTLGCHQKFLPDNLRQKEGVEPTLSKEKPDFESSAFFVDLVVLDVILLFQDVSWRKLRKIVRDLPQA
jgi:hypothetical protein